MKLMCQSMYQTSPGSCRSLDLIDSSDHMSAGSVWNEAKLDWTPPEREAKTSEGTSTSQYRWPGNETQET